MTLSADQQLSYETTRDLVKSRLEDSIKGREDEVKILIFVASLWVFRVFLLKFLERASRSELAQSWRITRKPITPVQVERESVWKYGYLSDSMAVLLLFFFAERFRNLPMWSLSGILLEFLIHVTLVEFLYYWWHRILHLEWFYKKMHQYHHKSIVTEPTTALSFEVWERVSYTILFSLPYLLTDLLDQQSYLSFALYSLWFDFMNEGGHINFEALPNFILKSPLRYIFYSPTFHSVHHTKFKFNFCLFMPWTDILFNTAVYGHPKDEEDHQQLHLQEDNKQQLPHTSEKNPDFVLLVHGGYLSSFYYSEKMSPRLSKYFRGEYKHVWWLYFLYPFLLTEILYHSYARVGHYVEESFLYSPSATTEDEEEKGESSHNNINQINNIDNINNHTQNSEISRVFHGETWIIKNMAIHYLMKSYQESVEARIEDALLEARRRNVRVLGLGNFNKAEWMNHGGTDLVKKLGNKLDGMYISHGDTLTAGVVLEWCNRLNQQNYWSRGVFITGSTSKIGRAVSLSLAQKGITVIMFSQCRQRFDEIQMELDEEHRRFLQYSCDLKDGKDCDLWITGKMTPAGSGLLHALPPSVTLLNFSVPDPLTPSLLKSRPDVLHLDSGLLEYHEKEMAPRFTWLLPKGRIYACLGGAIVHSVIGTPNHEVGPVDVSLIPSYWASALSLGFSLPPPSSFYSPRSLPPPLFSRGRLIST